MLSRDLRVQTNDIMKISIHKISNYVKLAEVVEIARQNKVVHFDNLFILAFLSKNLRYHENQDSGEV